MRTQVIQQRGVGAAWLEYLQAEGQSPKQVSIDKSPFCIGRNESADLHVDSNRVSREHAIIASEGGKYRVKDLDSTNGTFLNGRRIKEAALSHGDLLLVANVELTFYCGPNDAPRNTATQVMEFAAPDEQELAAGVIRAVRRLHEKLVQQSIEHLWQPIVRLPQGEPFGYEALGEGEDGCQVSEPTRLVMSTECRLTSRIRHLRRVLAAEEAAHFSGDYPIFTKLDSSEIGGSWLIESVARARRALPAHRAMVVELPYGSVSDTPYMRELHQRLNDLGVRLAYDEFSGGPVHVLRQTEIRPKYLKLAKSVVRGVGTSNERQKQIQAVARASQDIGCELIAVGIRSREDAQICHQMGCHLGQGPAFEGPRPERHRYGNQDQTYQAVGR